MSTSSKKRAVLVGCGRMGRNHLRILKESSHFEVAAVVDPLLAPDSLPELRDCRVVPNLEALDSRDFECGIVAASTAEHATLCLHLMREKKHVLVEKPLASTPEQCEQLIESARENCVHLVVGHVERFNPAVAKLKEIVETGLLGKPIHFSFTRVGGFPSHISQSDNVLIDLAIHDLDVLHYLCGPFSVRASICHSSCQPGVLDTAEILLASAGGASASIHVNWITPTKIRTIRVTGTKGVCFVDYMLQTCALWGGDLLRSMQDPTIEFQRLLAAYRNSDRVDFGIQCEEPLKVEIEHFYRCLVGSPHMCCSAEEGLFAVRMAQEALAGAALGHSGD